MAEVYSHEGERVEVEVEVGFDVEGTARGFIAIIVGVGVVTKGFVDATSGVANATCGTVLD